MVWLPEFSTALLPVDRGELTETLRPSVHLTVNYRRPCLLCSPNQGLYSPPSYARRIDNETADASQRHDAIAADSISRGTSLPGSNHIVPFLAV